MPACFRLYWSAVPAAEADADAAAALMEERIEEAEEDIVMGVNGCLRGGSEVWTIECAN